MNPIEEAFAYQAALSGPTPHGAVAKKFGTTVNKVKSRIALLDLPENLRESVARGEMYAGTADFIAKQVAGHEAMRGFVDALRASGFDLQKKIPKEKLKSHLPIQPHASFEGFADEFLAQTYRFRGALEAFVGAMEKGAWGELRRPHKRGILAESVRIAELFQRFEALETGRER